MWNPLPESFFLPSAKKVAPRLLGHWLIRNTTEGFSGGLIVETEAYLVDDPACHSFRGETKRNRAMWGAPGRAYVYLIYGYHFCVNAVCRPAGIAEAVLIRAMEPAFGVDLMRKNRPVKQLRDLSNGPAKLCEALRIDRHLDGTNLCETNSLLFIAENKTADQFVRMHGPIVKTTRVGISKATELPLRFYFEKNGFVSRR